jgi:hypothetical protein
VELHPRLSRLLGLGLPLGCSTDKSFCLKRTALTNPFSSLTRIMAASKVCITTCKILCDMQFDHIPFFPPFCGLVSCNPVRPCDVALSTHPFLCVGRQNSFGDVLILFFNNNSMIGKRKPETVFWRWTARCGLHASMLFKGQNWACWFLTPWTQRTWKETICRRPPRPLVRFLVKQRAYWFLPPWGFGVTWTRCFLIRWVRTNCSGCWLCMQVKGMLSEVTKLFRPPWRVRICHPRAADNCYTTSVYVFSKWGLFFPSCLFDLRLSRTNLSTELLIGIRFAQF